MDANKIELCIYVQGPSYERFGLVPPICIRSSAYALSLRLAASKIDNFSPGCPMSQLVLQSMCYWICLKSQRRDGMRSFSVLFQG